MSIDIAALLAEAQKLHDQDARITASIEVIFHDNFTSFSFSVMERGRYDKNYRAINRESRMAWELAKLNSTDKLIAELRHMLETVKSRIEK